jgi:hypothetical protein
MPPGTNPPRISGPEKRQEDRELAILKTLEMIDEKLQRQNGLIESFAEVFFMKQQADEELISKILGEGGPDTLEESGAAMERMRTGTLRSALEDDEELSQTARPGA